MDAKAAFNESCRNSMELLWAPDITCNFLTCVGYFVSSVFVRTQNILNYTLMPRTGLSVMAFRPSVIAVAL